MNCVGRIEEDIDDHADWTGPPPDFTFTGIHKEDEQAR